MIFEVKNRINFLNISWQSLIATMRSIGFRWGNVDFGFIPKSNGGVSSPLMNTARLREQRCTASALGGGAQILDLFQNQVEGETILRIVARKSTLLKLVFKDVVSGSQKVTSPSSTIVVKPEALR